MQKKIKKNSEQKQTLQIEYLSQIQNQLQTQNTLELNDHIINTIKINSMKIIKLIMKYITNLEIMKNKKPNN